ncbi:uncharacterized protein LOC131632678 [Vicia villosa]|uniref:uncharacterized protein LOC131632678 n=1 Tax=Vicia villosa TaxID=3911 RepID=UPI00273AEB62|nr:uncharacterized protein LOC131632678 [Vicia villosa]
MNEEIAKSFWASSKVGYSFSNSRGRSGGLLSLWNNEKLEVLLSFKGEGFLGIKLRWEHNFYYVINVYSSCDLIKKKALWEELLSLKESFKDGEWIVGGDFNAVKDGKERKGKVGLVNNREADLFAEFIDKSSLVDVPCKGKKFTWFSGDGKAKSRIDRFLLSSVVINRWEVVGQLIGDRDISDHCPIWIKTNIANWGPKPFKFNNEWFSLDSFLPFVEKAWKSMVVEGRGDYVLKEKLRILKDKLKE